VDIERRRALQVGTSGKGEGMTRRDRIIKQCVSMLKEFHINPDAYHVSRAETEKNAVTWYVRFADEGSYHIVEINDIFIDKFSNILQCRIEVK